MYAAPSSISKYMKQKLIEMKREIDKFTIVVGYFSTQLAVFGSTTRDKIMKNTDE